MKIHTTIGLYGSGTYKINGVKPENLKDHIEYNKKNRGGRALFVDGKCVYKGQLPDKQIRNFEQKIKDDDIFIKTIDTAPYK